MPGPSIIIDSANVICPKGSPSYRPVYLKEIGNSELATQDAIHPVIITHPESKKKALYVNRAFTLRFEGWTNEESKPLLDYLYDHAAGENNTTRFKWSPGSIAFWDNRSVLHKPDNDYWPQLRRMERITIDDPKRPY